MQGPFRRRFGVGKTISCADGGGAIAFGSDCDPAIRAGSSRTYLSFTANKVLSSLREVGVDRENGIGEWIRGMDKRNGNGLRRMGKGNGVRPVDAAREAVTRRPAGRRVTALMVLVFVGAVSFGLL